MSEDAVRGQLQRTSDAWWSVARTTPVPYFRPPYGEYDDAALRAAGSLGYLRTMLWDVDPGDYRQPGSSAIASDVVKSSSGGDIVILHVQDETADALPAILDGLHRRGLRCVSLPELFAAAGRR
jgi:peptidoglycan/xylan/chitin deacetylase (PgdA/CDA1 family)